MRHDRKIEERKLMEPSRLSFQLLEANAVL